MVGECPPGLIALDGPDRGRVGGQGRHEDGDPPGRDPPPVQVGEVDAVVAKQVGLDRVAMFG